MKEKLDFLVTLLLLVWVSFIWACSPLKPEQKSPEVLLEPLTLPQVQCLEQVANKKNILYIEQQSDLEFIGVGYSAPDGFYAATIRVNEEGKSCGLEFREKVANLEDPFEKKYEPVFKKIQRLDLTGDQLPDVYVWVDLYGVGRSGNARHEFYSRQANGKYRLVLSLPYCRGWSSVNILNSEDKERPIIMASEDVLCDWQPGEKDNTEFILTNTNREVIKTWRSE